MVGTTASYSGQNRGPVTLNHAIMRPLVSGERNEAFGAFQRISGSITDD
jgi:hypothetical protein